VVGKRRVIQWQSKDLWVRDSCGNQFRRIAWQFPFKNKSFLPLTPFFCTHIRHYGWDDGGTLNLCIIVENSGHIPAVGNTKYPQDGSFLDSRRRRYFSKRVSLKTSQVQRSLKGVKRFKDELQFTHTWGGTWEVTRNCLLWSTINNLLIPLKE